MTRLLLVDDDADTCALLSLYLVRQGLAVHTVQTISAAREELRSGRYDALLTDLELPDGSGRMLLAEGRPKGLQKAVVVSGHVSDKEQRESIAAGFDAHLGKPIDRSALCGLLVGSSGESNQGSS